MIVAEFACLIEGLPSDRRIKNAVHKFINSSKGATIELAVAKYISDAEHNARPKTLIGSTNVGDVEPLNHHVPSTKARACCGWPWWPFGAQARLTDLEANEQSPLLDDRSTSNVSTTQPESPEDISTSFNIIENSHHLEAVLLGVINECRFGKLS